MAQVAIIHVKYVQEGNHDTNVIGTNPQSNGMDKKKSYMVTAII